MRDNQKSRLYAAEDAALEVFGTQMTVEACQKEVDRITDLRGVRGRWGLRELRVVATNGRGGRTNGYEIRLGSHAKTVPYICHEVAHCLTPSKYADHGPEFAGVLLHVVRQAMGKEKADALRESFRKHGVRYSLKAIPKGLSPMPLPRAEQQKRHRAQRRDKILAALRRDIERGYVTRAEVRQAIDGA